MLEFTSLVFNKKSTVYEQIAGHVKRQILLKTAQNGDIMPSRRELAAITGINPNTAQKACKLMEDEGYLITNGNTTGTIYVTETLYNTIEYQLCKGMVAEFVSNARQNHLSYKKVIALISELWLDD